MAIECGIAVYKGKCLDEIDLLLEGEYLTSQFEMIFSFFYLLERGSSIHSKGIWKECDLCNITCFSSVLALQLLCQINPTKGTLWSMS